MCVWEHYLKTDEMERLVRSISNEIHGKHGKFCFWIFSGSIHASFM